MTRGRQILSPERFKITLLRLAHELIENYAENEERVAGTCQFIENPTRRSPEGEIYRNIASISPVGAAETYLLEFEKPEDYSLEDRIDAKTTILERPKHGVLKKTESKIGDRFQYIPDTGYHGEDSLVVLVEIRGIRIRIKQFLQVTGPYEVEAESCHGKNQTNMIWKISKTTGPDNEISLSSANYLENMEFGDS